MAYCIRLKNKEELYTNKLFSISSDIGSSAIEAIQETKLKTGQIIQSNILSFDYILEGLYLKTYFPKPRNLVYLFYIITNHPNACKIELLAL